VPGAAIAATATPPTLTFAPVSDTYVAQSTNVARGAEESFFVTNSRNALLAFPVVLPRGFAIKRALLKLTSDREYGPLMVGVFRAARPWHESQVTYSYADLAAGKKWDTAGGDWWDAAGLSQGDRYYVRASLKDDDASNLTRIDVTSLAQAWLSSAQGNTGMVLRALNTTAGQSFFSNNASAGQVRLEIQTKRVP